MCEKSRRSESQGFLRFICTKIRSTLSKKLPTDFHLYYETPSQRRVFFGIFCSVGRFCVRLIRKGRFEPCMYKKTTPKNGTDRFLPPIRPRRHIFCLRSEYVKNAAAHFFIWTCVSLNPSADVYLRVAVFIFLCAMSVRL